MQLSLSPQLQIRFATKADQERFADFLILCGIDKYKSFKKSPEIRLAFDSHQNRLEFLVQLSNLAAQVNQGITFMRISIGTCSWDYITNEEDLPFLVLAAQAHCLQIDARRKQQYAF